MKNYIIILLLCISQYSCVESNFSKADRYLSSHETVDFNVRTNNIWCIGKFESFLINDKVSGNIDSLFYYLGKISEDVNSQDLHKRDAWVEINIATCDLKRTNPNYDWIKNPEGVDKLSVEVYASYAVECVHHYEKIEAGILASEINTYLDEDFVRYDIISLEDKIKLTNNFFKYLATSSHYISEGTYYSEIEYQCKAQIEHPE